MKGIKIIIPIIIFLILIYVYVTDITTPKGSSNQKISTKTVNNKSIPKISLILNNFTFLKNNFNFSLTPSQNSYYVNKLDLNSYSIAINLGFSSSPQNTGGGSFLWTGSVGKLIYSNNTYFEYLKEGKRENIQYYVSKILNNTFNMGTVSFSKKEYIVGNTYVYKFYPMINNQYIYSSGLHRIFENITLYSNKSIKSFSILPIELEQKYGYSNKIKLSYVNMNKFPLYISNISGGAISNISISKIENEYYYDFTTGNIIPIYMIFGNVVIMNKGEFRYEGIIPKIKHN